MTVRVFFIAATGRAAAEPPHTEKEPLRTEKGKSSGRATAYGETKAAAETLRTEKDYSLNIRTMKELLKLWKADCEAEGFSNEDYIVIGEAVVLFSIFLAIL